jgi:hypothetical protein
MFYVNRNLNVFKNSSYMSRLVVVIDHIWENYSLLPSTVNRVGDFLRLFRLKRRTNYYIIAFSTELSRAVLAAPFSSSHYTVCSCVFHVFLANLSEILTICETSDCEPEWQVFLAGLSSFFSHFECANLLFFCLHARICVTPLSRWQLRAPSLHSTN